MEQSYILQYGVSALSTTSTKFGIATKDLLRELEPSPSYDRILLNSGVFSLLIVATDRGQLQSLPRRLFDPRRPNRKPTSQEQQDEWLIQYEPVIPNDPRRTISHNYNVSIFSKTPLRKKKRKKRLTQINLRLLLAWPPNKRPHIPFPPRIYLAHLCSWP